ncbi:hypothetical protein O3P69_006898 [Scylla paramamosain]|uniref:Secreted protein n=1 Tax=Scylla paramamosain TaxID=85552 RepID=A0AAW0U524_SCYPA
MSTFTYLLAVATVVAALSGRAECRPQTAETRDVEAVGGNLFVGKRQKKKPRDGPSVSALVAEPPVASVGVSAGLSLVPSEAKVELAASR